MDPLKIFGSLTNSFIIHLNQLARNIIVRRRDYVENFMGTEVLKRNRLRTQSAKFSIVSLTFGPHMYSHPIKSGKMSFPVG